MKAHRLTRLLGSVAAGVAVFGMAHGAQAQAFPEETIHIVVPFSPGGPTDTAARMIAEGLPELLGVSVVVDNLPGAGGTVGAASVAGANPDGYTLLFGSTSSISIAPVIHEDLPYDPVADFAPIALATAGPHIFFVSPDSAFESVADLVAYGQENPGELDFGSAGSGTPLHLAAELFSATTGIEAVHVPYAGGSEARAAVMGGEVDFAFDTISSVAGPARDGSVRALALAADERADIMPDLPTMGEEGYPEVLATSWNGLFAPAGTPDEAIDVLNEAVREFMGSEAMQTRLEELGLLTRDLTPAQFADFISGEVERAIRSAELAGLD